MSNLVHAPSPNIADVGHFGLAGDLVSLIGPENMIGNEVWLGAWSFRPGLFP